jgi:anti-sigma regulatory factor (Ser/Thr protein kinase)
VNENDVEPDPDVRYQFHHSLQAPSEAREELDAVFAEPDDPVADDARVATSELVTNVVVHTDDGGELRVWDPRPDAPLRIEVEDDDPAPAEIPSTPPPVGGRGLLIVDAIADRWGVHPTQRGKVVWAEFDRNRRPSERPDFGVDRDRWTPDSGQ